MKIEGRSNRCSPVIDNSSKALYVSVKFRFLGLRMHLWPLDILRWHNKIELFPTLLAVVQGLHISSQHYQQQMRTRRNKSFPNNKLKTIQLSNHATRQLYKTLISGLQLWHAASSRHVLQTASFLPRVPWTGAGRGSERWGEAGWRGGGGTFFKGQSSLLPKSTQSCALRAPYSHLHPKPTWQYRGPSTSVTLTRSELISNAGPPQPKKRAP